MFGLPGRVGLLGTMPKQSGVSADALVSALVLAGGGAIYTPSDLTSLYQSRNGGSTGATGQPVGIMLDKSYMGGQTAAAFIAGQAAKALGSWTPGSGTTVGGGGELIFSAATSSSYADPTLQNGKTYQLVFTVSGFSAGQVFPKFGNSSGPVAIANGTYTYVGLCASGAPFLYFAATGFTGTVTVISVKEIPGFHALAPSDAARPVLASEDVGGATHWYLEVDGVDDFMIVTPTLNLTATWWGVGAWRPSATGNVYMFALSDLGTKAASKINAGNLGWRNAADLAFTNLIGGTAVNVPFVSTHVQTSLALIAGRLNGVDKSSFAPFDASASALGLALFSDKNLTSSQPYAGRFYGGAFAPGAITSDNRTIVEAYMATLSGVIL